MSSIVYQINKKTGAKYAFESISYWDKDKQQPRSKRKYLGKVDPETGEIIPSRGRTSHSGETEAGTEADLARLHEEISDREQTIKDLRNELDELKDKYEDLLDTVRKIKSMLETF